MNNIIWLQRNFDLPHLEHKISELILYYAVSLMPQFGEDDLIHMLCCEPADDVLTWINSKTHEVENEVEARHSSFLQDHLHTCSLFDLRFFWLVPAFD